MTIKIDSAAIPLPRTASGELIGEKRTEMRADLADGKAINCPCCGLTLKVYARGIHGRMVSALAGLLKGPLSPSQLSAMTSGGDAMKLEPWGLIEQHRETGAWAITSKGIRFLKGEISLPHRALWFDGQVIGFDDSKRIKVSDVRYAGVDLAGILASWGHTAAA